MVNPQQSSIGPKIARRLLLVLGAIIFVFFLGLLCFFPFAKNFGWREAPVENRRLLTDYCGRGDQPNYVYSYVVDGKIYHTSECSPSLKSVIYPPTYPARNFTGSMRDYVILLVLAAMGVIVMGVALRLK